MLKLLMYSRHSLHRSYSLLLSKSFWSLVERTPCLGSGTVLCQMPRLLAVKTISRKWSPDLHISKLLSGCHKGHIWRRSNHWVWSRSPHGRRSTYWRGKARHLQNLICFLLVTFWHPFSSSILFFQLLQSQYMWSVPNVFQKVIDEFKNIDPLGLHFLIHIVLQCQVVQGVYQVSGLEKIIKS